MFERILFEVDKSENSRYYSVQTLLSSRLPSKNLKIKIYKTIVLPVVSYGCETWLLTLREEYRLRVFGNGILRRVLGPKRDENKDEKDITERKFMVFTLT